MLNSLLENVQPQEVAQKKEETILDAAIVCRTVEGKGRGVFAQRAIREGEIVECAPVVPMAKEDVPEDSPPDGYVLDWDEDTEGEEHALVLGYIMLYNHSNAPNLRFESDLEEYTVTAIASRNIEAGEELTWDYNCELWFDPQ